MATGFFHLGFNIRTEYCSCGRGDEPAIDARDADIAPTDLLTTSCNPGTFIYNASNNDILGCESNGSNLVSAVCGNGFCRVDAV